MGVGTYFCLKSRNGSSRDNHLRHSDFNVLGRIVGSLPFGTDLTIIAPAWHASRRNGLGMAQSNASEAFFLLPTWQTREVRPTFSRCC
jgi:hypothetical protein